MIRLGLCVVVLGGTIAFLSCSASPTGGSGPPSVSRHTDGMGPPLSGRPGLGGNGGVRPVGTGGRTAGGDGGTGVGSGAFGGSLPTDGQGPLGGSYGDGSAPIGGQNGSVHTDGAGPTGVLGGYGGFGGGVCFGGGDCFEGVHPCDGLRYLELVYCASTYAERLARPIGGSCEDVTTYVSHCEGKDVWSTESTGLGETCIYDGTGTLVAARVCTDSPRWDWNCNGAPQSPLCLSAGTVPDTMACARTPTCAASNGGQSGSLGGQGGP